MAKTIKRTLGLTSKDVKRFKQLITKANLPQLNKMVDSIKTELGKRD